MPRLDFKVLTGLITQLPNIIVIGILVFGGLFAYKEFTRIAAKFDLDLMGLRNLSLNEQQRKIDELNRQYLQLSQNIARAQTTIVSGKELEKVFQETVDQRIQDIMKQNKEEVSAISKAVASLESYLQTNLPSAQQWSVMTRDSQLVDLEMTYVYADSQEGNRGIRLAQLVFDDTNKEWDKFTEPLQFEVTSVRSEQLSGTFNHYIEAGLKNPYDPIYKNTSYKLGIDTFRVLERKLKKSSWHIIQPHVEGGLGTNVTTDDASIAYDLGVSLIAYGPSPHDNSWRFGRVGLGIINDADKVFGSLSPVGVNMRTIGVWFLKDTWIFPGLSLRKGGDLGFATSLSTTF